MIPARPWLLVVFATALTIVAQPSQAQLFESNSKRFTSSKMDIVVREYERRPHVSVLNIEIKTIGSSVGSSFFILCSIRTLAQLRGNHRYIVKIEDRPKRGQMLVGFLTIREENLERLGEVSTPECFSIGGPGSMPCTFGSPLRVRRTLFTLCALGTTLCRDRLTVG